MNTILIGYDLNTAGQDYKELIDAIKALANDWWHCLDSTWIIKTNLGVVQVRDALMQHIDSNDELLVLTVNGAAAWTGFKDNCSTWLKSNL